MTDEEIKSYIDQAIERSIKAYKKNGLLKGGAVAAYTDASEVLSSYFKNGKTDVQITYAIQTQRFDPYFRIISLYYEQGNTIEQIAEDLGVDTSTVMRNKKRLCLAIYENII
jgi:DNA-directed RNA polymerase specialized sigma24 family protein